jgi:hypothetical protein
LQNVLSDKKETNKITSTLKEVHRAIRIRSGFVLFSVKLTKIGTVPKGLMTEKSAAKARVNNSIVFSAKFAHWYGIKIV